MSKTPRTDEHILHHGNGNWHPSAFVLASFARQIETELAEARAEIERLRSRNKMLDTAIAEMTEEQAALCAEEQSITELVATKDKLIEQMKDEIERLALEIENKQYTITCESEENQQLKESLAEARVEIEKQDKLLEKCLILLKQQKEGGE